jgi:hypothetical protein
MFLINIVHHLPSPVLSVLPVIYAYIESFPQDHVSVTLSGAIDLTRCRGVV